MRVDIWSDVVCPWCYIGKRRFEHALAGFDRRDEVEVVYRSFELNPDMPRGEVSPKAQLLVAKFGKTEAEVREIDAQMEQLAARDGLEYNLSDGIVGNTFDAHRVLHLAKERGLQQAATEQFFKAYFTEKRSLFDAESLADVAVAAGLARDEVLTVLKEGTYADEVQEDIARARALGANGVPFFVLDNRYGVSGAQPTETFTAALTKAFQA
ncbi:DsbA family oxidoreductase [Amycolatopsis pithecellobii]|uniref:Thioredoxin domain-containing protein n=1 Tax=Amycolatopsis pithecellobii TaxID=664692 RepID=A0A6N7ZA20_9PSEU|nr:DsbA family oxidoreductase [Amycolatopsis pithecellobii]MTD58585.1 thioredoxin domain-containing protein [Amycolatopsis pithecellobii]